MGNCLSSKKFINVVTTDVEKIDDQLRIPNVQFEWQPLEDELLQGEWDFCEGYLLPRDQKWELPDYVKITEHNPTRYCYRNQGVRLKSHIDLKLDLKIGCGRFFDVFTANVDKIQRLKKHKIVAAKMLKNGINQENFSSFYAEIQLMKLIDHKNIIKLLAISQRTAKLFVLLEYAEYGCLTTYLKHQYSSQSDEFFTEHGGRVLKELISFGVGVARGMKYLSSRSFIHRDLSARNVLVCNGPVAKISDFGLSRNANDEYISCHNEPIHWMALESLEHQIFTIHSDVWAYGVVLWEIMTLGKLPFECKPNSVQLISMLRDGKRLECPINCPGEIYALMEKCWDGDEWLRPSFAEIVLGLEHFKCPNEWKPTALRSGLENDENDNKD